MVHTLRPLAVLSFDSALYIIPDESRPVFGLVVTLSIKPVVLFSGTDTPRGPIRPPLLYLRAIYASDWDDTIRGWDDLVGPEA